MGSALCAHAVCAVHAVLDAMCDTLQGWGLEVEQLHPEAAPGQFELVTRYSDALQVGRVAGYRFPFLLFILRPCLQYLRHLLP